MWFARSVGIMEVNWDENHLVNDVYIWKYKNLVLVSSIKINL